MATVESLPEEVIALVRGASIAEFATVSGAGVPIDTPTSHFPNDDLSQIDITTGLAYPIKAERARRNPKVGLLVEGRKNQPVVSIAGHAAVRDADLQANVLRYLSESSSSMPGNPPWEMARKANWYWVRVLVSITPVRILWWDRPSAMNAPPHRWDAPAPDAYPQSDPEPPAPPSPASKWPQPAWPDLAADILSHNASGHLTLLDDEGYPLPIRVHAAVQTSEGFYLRLPKGTPWRRQGKATICFEGKATFIGEVSTDGDAIFLKVERALPVLPLMRDLKELFEPTPETYEIMMKRLREEVARRGQDIPIIPEIQPEPTEGAKRRLASGLIPPAQAKAPTTAT